MIYLKKENAVNPKKLHLELGFEVKQKATRDILYAGIDHKGIVNLFMVAFLLKLSQLVVMK